LEISGQFEDAVVLFAASHAVEFERVDGISVALQQCLRRVLGVPVWSPRDQRMVQYHQAMRSLQDFENFIHPPRMRSRLNRRMGFGDTLGWKSCDSQMKEV